MAKFNTFKYGDGTKYTDPSKLVFYYGVVADPLASTTGGLSFQSTQRVSLKITQSGGFFTIFALRPIVEDGGYYPANFNVNSDQQNLQRVSLKISHSNGTLFQIQQLRPIVETLQQEPIG